MPRDALPRPRRLLALDLDGSLLRRGGAIDRRDLRAIARAQRAGVAVTIATGRLAGGALGIARALDLTTPILCADGGATVCPASSALLHAVILDEEVVAAIVGALGASGLAPFVLLHDAIHGEASDAAMGAYLGGWSPLLRWHPSLPAARVWRRPGAAVMALGAGERARVEGALPELARAFGAELDLAVFPLGEGAPWAIRAQPRRASKGAALARLAGDLGLPRADVGALGDGLNDLSMLAWAGRSFAMGHAPAAVRAAATDRLAATRETGGGVAEAIERWLGP